MGIAIFDLDGTLIDTADEIHLAVNRTLADFKAPEASNEDVRRWIGHGTGWLMKQAWAKHVGDPEATDWQGVMDKFIAHYYDTAGQSSQLFPHVEEVLNTLRSRGVKTAIVTNKEHRFTVRVLEAHGLDKLLDIVVSGDTLPVKKPNPAGILHCIDTAGETRATSLFIGDSEIDVATAKAAEVTCWAVPYGYNHGKPISTANPDRLIDDIRPALEFFA